MINFTCEQCGKSFDQPHTCNMCGMPMCIECYEHGEGFCEPCKCIREIERQMLKVRCEMEVLRGIVEIQYNRRMVKVLQRDKPRGVVQ